MADDALTGMYVDFQADYTDLDSAQGNVSAIFAGIAASATIASEEITDSLTGASEGFSAIGEAAGSAGMEVEGGLMVGYEALGQLGEESASAAEAVSGSLNEVNFDGFQSALTSLAESVSAATAQINEQLASIPAEADDSAAKSQSAFSGFDLGGMVTSVGMGIFAFQNLANAGTQLATGLLQPAMNAEQMQESFTNLTGSASAAGDELNKLDAFAADTQFTTMDINSFGADLLGVGTKASSVIPDIKAVGDNLSAVGKGTPAEVQSVIDIFGKMSTQGKITTMDLNELGNHGIKALQDIAAGAGLSTAEVQKMIANGTLPAKQAIDDLTKGIEANPIYAGGMTKQSGTLSGIMSTLSSDWDVFMSKIASPALPELEDGLGKLTALLTDPSFQKFATEVGVDIVNGVKTFATDISNLVATGENVVNFFKNNKDAMDALVAMLISGAGIVAGVLIPALVGWAAAQWAVAIPVIATAAPFIALGLVVAAVVFGIIEGVQHAADIAKFFQGIWADVATFWQNDVAKPFENGINAVDNAFNGFGKMMSGVWDGIGNTIKGGINDIIGGIDSFIGFIDGIQIHIPSIGIGPARTPAFDWNGLGIPKIPLLSTGGSVPPGGVGIAGDPGPYSELVFGGTSGLSVLSHTQSAAMLSASAQGAGSMSAGGNGGTSGEMHIHVHLGTEEVANLLVDTVGQKIVKKWLSQGPVRSVR